MKQKLTAACFLITVFSTDIFAQQPNFDNLGLGAKKSMVLASQMPYMQLKMGDADGFFLLDFGSNISSMDHQNFNCGAQPKTTPPASLTYETDYTFSNFDFFGPQGIVKIKDRKTQATDLGLSQAGIIGTDFFMGNIFTLNYSNQAVYCSAKASFCSDDVLIKNGFKPVSTAGYYADQFSRLIDPNKTINVPTVPVRIGMVAAVAQIDPGFDDKNYRHSVNINTAFYKAIKAKGIQLIPMPEGDQTLSTCVTTSEKVTAYKLGQGYNFEIVGKDNKAVIISSDAKIFVKNTPPDAMNCGGIGTWTIPAAQIGASFLADAKCVVFDPFSSVVWFYTK